MGDKEFYISLCKEGQVYIPVFMQPWWLDAVCGAWDVIIARKGEHISGAWAYPVENKVGVSLLRNPPLTPYLGPQVFYPEGMKESSMDSFEHEAISELVGHLPAVKVWGLTMWPGMKQAGIFKNMGLRTQVLQTFLLELYADEHVLHAEIKEAVRKKISTAEKEYTIGTTEDTNMLYDLCKDQKHNYISYSRSELARVVNICAMNKAGTLWTAKKGGNIEAMLWHIWDSQNSYYMLGGQRKDVSEDALALLLWTAIKDARQRGHVIFDMLSGIGAGVEHYFRSFGGERALFMMLHKNDSILWKMKEAVAAGI